MKPALTLHHSSRDVEEALKVQFRQLNWIGELDLPEQEYDVLCRVARGVGKTNDGIRIDRVPPLLLITSMVFSARYTEFDDDDYPSFWRPYAQNVWKLDGADQNFQNACRKHFRKIRTQLEDEYGFSFPHKRYWYDQDVVSGIYTHAILPNYLEDDFARWLITLWSEGESWTQFVSMPLDLLGALLRDHPSLQTVRRRLRYFIEGDETVETAARLVQTLAIAAIEFNEGTEATQIAEMLSHVERGVWEELYPELIGNAAITTSRQQQRSARQRFAQAEWAWNLDTMQSAVMVKNLRVAGNIPPDRVVWVRKLDELREYRYFTSVNPWKTADGWELDSVFINDVAETGIIALVDERDHLLGSPLNLPVFPKEQITFFKPVADNRYAVRSEIDRVRDGEWIISRVDGVRLLKEHQPMTPHTPLSPLNGSGHHHAGQYNLKLPLDIIDRDEIISLTTKKERLTGLLVGEKVVGLSPDTVPVFTTPPMLQMTGNADLEVQKQYLRVRIMSAEGVSKEIRLDSAIQIQDDIWTVPLKSLSPGVYSVMVYRKLVQILPEPLHFAVLPPHIKVHSPAEPIYSVNNPPQVFIEGCLTEAIENPFGELLEEPHRVRVRWANPRFPVRLYLIGKSYRIPIQWSVHWVHAWAENIGHDGTVTEDEIDSIYIYLRGLPYTSFEIYVGSGSPYVVNLKSEGEEVIQVQFDRIKDMLKAYHGGNVPVKAMYSGQSWLLFTLIRTDLQAFEHLPHIVKTAIRSARNLKRSSSRRLTAIAAHDKVALFALPPAELEAFSDQQVETISPVLKALRNVSQIPLDQLPQGVIPTAYPIVLQLADSSEKIDVKSTAPLSHMGSGIANLALSPTVLLPVEVRWEPAEDQNRVQVLLFPKTPVRLRLCSVCRQFFIEDNASKLAHSHGKGWGLKHFDPSITPFQAYLHFDSAALFTTWQPNFDAVLDRSVISSYRIRKDQASRQPHAPLYTASGYRYAVAEWSLNMHTAALLSQLEMIVHPANTDNLNVFRKYMFYRDHQLKTPAMVALGHLLEKLSFDQNDRWYNLDLSVLAVSILSRAGAYNVSEYEYLNKKVPHDWYINTLINADAACPSLLAWAFTWTEHYFQILHKQEQQ